MNVRNNLERDERIRKELGLSPEEIRNYKINRRVCRGVPEIGRKLGVVSKSISRKKET